MPQVTSQFLRVLFMGILASIFGRAFGAEPAAGHIGREDGFVDITLPIAEHIWAKDGSLTVIARGKIDGQIVGFAVDVGSRWKPQPIENMPVTIYWGKGDIRKIGLESDSFLSLLAHEYGLPTPKHMAGRVEITMASIGSDPSDLRVEPAKIKVFFEAGGEASYGEASSTST